MSNEILPLNNESTPHRPMILVVEDEPSIRKMIATVLRRDGCEVVEADNPKTALEKMGASLSSVQLVLTDMHMPNMNGAQFIEELTLKIPDLQVLIVTGAETELSRHAARLQNVRVLLKPFSFNQLRVAASDALQRRGTKH